MGSATALIAGHTDSVLCLEVQPGGGKLLASGGEDGMICLTDLSTLKPAGKLRQTLGDAVPSLCWHPGAGAQLNLFAAAGSAVAEFDLRRGMDASAAVRSFAVNQEEVNSVAVSAANGGWLAAGDDGGEVQVISLQDTQRARQDAQQAQQDDEGQQAAGGSALLPGGSAAGSLREPSRPLSYKTLRRGHSNICSAVAFRPHRPWELLSGGLDCTVVKWDFSRLRTLHGWSLSGEAAASGGQLVNPPMVHALAVPHTDDRDLCRLFAAARGDGCIGIYDADHKAPASSGGGGKSGGGKKGSKARGKGAGAQPAGHVPGRLALLGREAGGHSAAVNSVAFVPRSGWEQLLSAGNDCRVLLWNWRRACVGPSAELQDSPQPGEDQPRQGEEQQPDAPESSGSPSDAVPLLAAEHKHGRKVNWACPADVPGCPFNVFLADTGRRITALHLA